MENYKITVGIPTRNRYDLLSHTLLSIAFQTKKPDEVIIVDDSDTPADLRQHQTYDYIFKLFDDYKIGWKVVFGAKKGQHFSHQLVQDNCLGNLIFRIDDDCVAEPDTLEKLLSCFNEKIGGVAPLVLMPYPQPLPNGVDNIITDLSIPNLQWFKWSGQKKVDHLYSCFLYRKGIAKYNLSLSRKAFREETLLTYEIKRAGYDLVVNGDAIVRHFMARSGGIR